MLDVARLPKAEFHLHLEATLGWREFAGWMASPEYDGLPRAPWLGAADPFPTFQEFLAPWRDHIAVALKQPRAYERWVEASAAWLASLGVRYAEVSVGMNFMEKLGHNLEEAVPAMCRAMEEAERVHGIELRLVGALKRNATPAENARWVERWIALAASRLAGIDLHGYELEGPTAPQKPAFDLARSAGLRLRAHAGEHGTWRDVRDAVEVLGVASVNHGVRAVDDAGFVRELAARRVALHVCPTSNVLLHVCPSYREHPIRQLMDAGVLVTVNSDDPLVFGTDINAEFASLRLQDDEVRLLLRNAWDCALVTSSLRRTHLQAIR
ncbi:MAG: adenosine deaminase family protein [Planctomycetota bacterium]